MNEATETGCCPRFDPGPWEDQEFRWDEKLFVKDRVRSLFHIPINFGPVMVRNMKAIEAAGVKSPEGLLLAHENSLWGADVYIGVTGDVPGATMVRLSGDFVAKVFEGPFRMISQWTREMKELQARRGKPWQRLLNWYTTCPRCAKAYGKNYVVLLAEQ